ncbi:heat shock protein HslJ [Atlantibacter hermannii]|uniref:heat shock protein HslJ n=1 Tax=Atlantibacter hermannii TaxID=565 RepID=UPI0028A1BC66|nr:heat shock protein HslJ [Atlantibacter hermannii]
MKKLTCLALGAALLAGCAQTARQGDAPQLEHRRYMLESVDGKPVMATQRPLDISFGEKLHVSGGMCNRFMGQGKLDGNVLKVDGMASTRMLCAEPELNQFDILIGEMLTSGATVDAKSQSLILSNQQHTLVYKSADWVN